MVTTALFVSPHLDDVAFSCGGTLITLARQGWRTVLATAFTASVPAPTGFALACQLDKGLGADVDYLALRRGEDERFAERAGVDRLAWLDLPEAPHRGYGSAGELFGPDADGDDVAGALTAALADLVDDVQPDVVLAPQALGAHVDHRRVAEAVVAVMGDDAAAVTWYRDVPYAIRHPRSVPALASVAELPETAVDITTAVDAKAHAAQAYATQLDFQFGGPQACADALHAFATAEAHRLNLPGAAEVFRASASQAFSGATDGTGSSREVPGPPTRAGWPR